MASLGIAQRGNPELVRIAQSLRLPAEAGLAKGLAAVLLATTEQVQAHHHFTNGLGIAATQLGFEHAVIAVRSWEGEYLTLFNPKIVECSTECDEQYEGCLSFFDVRGLVSRPLRITVAHTDLEGMEHKTEFGPGLARLVAHELDHLEGWLYTAHLRTPLMSIEEYRRIWKDLGIRR
jgi:peptide deformylase